jgi:hypothetical protein
MPAERWAVGDVTVTKVIERELSAPIEVLGEVLMAGRREVVHCGRESFVSGCGSHRSDDGGVLAGLDAVASGQAV